MGEVPHVCRIVDDCARVGESQDAAKGGDVGRGKEGRGDPSSRVEVDELVVTVEQGDEEDLSRCGFVLKFDAKGEKQRN